MYPFSRVHLLYCYNISKYIYHVRNSFSKMGVFYPERFVVVQRVQDKEFEGHASVPALDPSVTVTQVLPFSMAGGHKKYRGRFIAFGQRNR